MKNEKNIVIKSNTLLEGNYQFTALEMKITLMVLAKIKQKDDEFHTYRLHLDDFQDMTQAANGKPGTKTHYNYLKRVCETLRSKNITIPKKTGGHIFTSWFTTIETYEGKGYVDFDISTKLKPYLLQLRKEFTLYDVRNVLNCRSAYSIKIYQLLKQYEKIGNRIITIENLRQLLDLKYEYTRWMNLKTRVIEVAKKELQKNSDIYFGYKLHKKGRVVVSIEFIIKRQKQQRLFDTETPIKSKKSGYIDLTTSIKSETSRLISKDTITSKQFKELAK